MEGKISVVQQLLIDALLMLSEQYPIDDITITQLTQEAKVARKTFYLNFDNKEQIISLYIKQMRIEFKCILDNEEVSDLETLTKFFFEFFKRYSNFLNILIDNKKFDLMIAQFEVFIEGAMISKYTSNIFDTEAMTNMEKEYLTKYHTAGLWKMLQVWLTSGMVESSVEMSKLYNRILRVETT